jgi:hypothetical protein
MRKKDYQRMLGNQELQLAAADVDPAGRQSPETREI